ncbi:restriction endonuclease subunit S [Flavobacterium sp. CS20]|uniref:restriction endonuclease subunit S n=1 Tax=Flavobacterium sp. CS20 TaxID=2775246 RepID=UPI001B3A1F5B|nr:restriction endonuclease subunit S [Flavobacterium sp. CS20]QTY27056.1 restriction endonuclease subunit S [Flavobacterium sp. CS20]
MKNNYKRLGDYIELVDERNEDLAIDILLGLSISKEFIPSVANTIGTNMKRYKIVHKNQFACSIMQVRRDGKMPVAILKSHDKAIISQAYPVFKVKDESVLNPDYLMMWFKRKEFDREATFHAVGGVRGSLEWGDFMNFKLPIPPIEKQREIVAEYNAVDNRIRINEQLNQKLEETAQAIYKEWFVDFNFPITAESCPELVSGSPELVGQPYKSSGGKMVYNEELDKEIPKGWEVIEFQEITEITSGKTLKTKSGDKYPVYGAGGITCYTNVFLYESTVIIIGRVGTHGKVFIEHGKSWPTDNTLVFIPKYLYYSYFILKYLNYDELNKGGVQALLTQTDLKQLKIIFPKIRLADFEKKMSGIFKFNKNLETKKLEKLKDLLLSKMSKVEVEKEME